MNSIKKIYFAELSKKLCHETELFDDEGFDCDVSFFEVAGKIIVEFLDGNKWEVVFDSGDQESDFLDLSYEHEPEEPISETDPMYFFQYREHVREFKTSFEFDYTIDEVCSHPIILARKLVSEMIKNEISTRNLASYC